MSVQSASFALHNRADSFAAVYAAMGRAMGGSAELVAVTGAPGTGRSAFLDAVADRAACDGFVVGRDRGSRLRRAVRFAVAERLGPVAEHRPAALVVDDLQWVDEASLNWLAGLVDGPESVPLLLVVAVCEGEANAELPIVQDMLTVADEVIPTPPLDVRGVRAMLADRGVRLTEAAARDWAQATGGNPALLVSLLDRLPDPQIAAPADLLAVARSRPSPWQLRARVAAALSDHPDAVRRLAHCAALLGGGHLRTLARITRIDPNEKGAARALLRLGWTADRGVPPVLWDCVREIAQDGLPLAERTDLYRRAAELLYAAGAPAERIAPHIMEIGPGEWRDAGRVLREAADDALRLGNVDLAIRCLRRALREFPPDSPQRGDLLAALAEAEQHTDTSATLRHVSQALPLLTTAQERAAALTGIPLTLFISAAPAAAEMRRSARAAFAALGTGTGTADLRLGLEARVRLLELSGPGAIEAAVQRLRELRPGPGPGTAALRELVSVLTFAGILDGRLSAPEVAALVQWMLDHEPASTASGDGAPALIVAAGITAEADTPVRSWLDMAIDAATRRGDQRQRIRLLGWRALAALHVGGLADAWTDALEIRTAGCETWADADWLTVIGLTWLAVAMRDPRWADGLGGVVIEDPQTLLPVCGLAQQALWAVLTSDSEPPAPAAGLLDAVLGAETAGWCSLLLFPVDLWCAPLLLRDGDSEAAYELLARAYDRARAFGSSTARGRVLRVWGTVVPGRHALSLLAESVTVLRESADTLELGRALMVYGRRLRAAGRPGSDELFAEADRIAAEAGESLLRCWTVPAAAGLSRVLQSGSDGLTETEHRVAAMVALNHTNQDIADTLGVSRRAVEKTLTRLYRWMDVAGRDQLIPKVRRMAGAAAFRVDACAAEL